MRIFSVYPLGSADEHRIDIDVHALYGHACGLGDLVADFVHNTAAQGVEIHAVIDGDVQFKRDAAVLVELRLDAAAHVLALELENTAVPALGGHGLDTEAARSRVSGQVGKNLVFDGDGSLRVFNLHHGATPFASSTGQRPNGSLLL